MSLQRAWPDLCCISDEDAAFLQNAVSLQKHRMQTFPDNCDFFAPGVLLTGQTWTPAVEKHSQALAHKTFLIKFPVGNKINLEYPHFCLTNACFLSMWSWEEHRLTRTSSPLVQLRQVLFRLLIICCGTSWLWWCLLDFGSFSVTSTSLISYKNCTDVAQLY